MNWCYNKALCGLILEFKLYQINTSGDGFTKRLNPDLDSKSRFRLLICAVRHSGFHKAAKFTLWLSLGLKVKSAYEWA